MQRCKHFIGTASYSQSIHWAEWCWDGVPRVDYYNGYLEIDGLIVEVDRLTAIDIVPAREVAIYRGYENVVNSIARSMGAPIGGILLDTIGWRW